MRTDELGEPVHLEELLRIPAATRLASQRKILLMQIDIQEHHIAAETRSADPDPPE